MKFYFQKYFFVNSSAELEFKYFIGTFVTKALEFQINCEFSQIFKVYLFIYLVAWLF